GGTARHFDGNAQVFEAPAAAALDFSGGYTLTAWVKPERVPVMFDNILGRPIMNSETDSYGLDVQAPGVADFYTQPDNNLVGTTHVVLGQWFHIAASYDGTTKRIYFDGARENQAAAQPPTYDASPLVLGGDIGTAGISSVILGALADIRLYDRALSDSEIVTLAQP